MKKTKAQRISVTCQRSNNVDAASTFKHTTNKNTLRNNKQQKIRNKNNTNNKTVCLFTSPFLLHISINLFCISQCIKSYSTMDDKVTMLINAKIPKIELFSLMIIKQIIQCISFYDTCDIKIKGINKALYSQHKDLNIFLMYIIKFKI